MLNDSGKLNARVCTEASVGEQPSCGQTPWKVHQFSALGLDNIANADMMSIMAKHDPETRMAIVCSGASSKRHKREGSSDILLNVMDGALALDSPACSEMVHKVRMEHVLRGRATLNHTKLLDRYITDVDVECDRLLKVLHSARCLKAMTRDTRDMIIHIGDRLSCLYICALLQSQQVSAIMVDLGDCSISTSCFDEEYYTRIGERIGHRLRAIDSNTIPVVTGYLDNTKERSEQAGISNSQLLTALTAVGLNAQELLLWGHIDGIFTADQTKVPTAKLLRSIWMSEAAELVVNGSSILDLDSMDHASRANIPMRIKNILHPSSPGTLILPDPPTPALPPGILRTRSSSYIPSQAQQQTRHPTAVTIKRGIAVLNIQSSKRTRTLSFPSSLFACFDDNNNTLSIDLISSSQVHVSIAVSPTDPTTPLWTKTETGHATPSEDLQDVLEKLRQWGRVEVVVEQAMLTVVGRQLRRMTGFAGRLFEVLGRVDVNVEMISQGASEISVGCVIEERQADRALGVVHCNLFSYLD